jgi:hypothetical protein
MQAACSFDQARDRPGRCLGLYFSFRKTLALIASLHETRTIRSEAG